jgi:Zn-dependent protease
MGHHCSRIVTQQLCSRPRCALGFGAVMREQGIWSVGLGRWNGVHVRLHMFFLVFAAFTVYLGWLDASQPAADGNPWIGISCVLVLLCSVVVHELGHLFFANRLGATVDELVIGPFGGLGPLPAPLEPQGELLTTLAGPLANLLVCTLCALGLLLAGSSDLLGLLHPFAPRDILSGTPLVLGLKLTMWINWLLVLINLIPAFPFDGGRGVRATLMLIHPGMEPARAVWSAARLAKVTAVGLVVLALVSIGTNPGYTVPTWFALLLLAIFVYFSARKEELVAQHSASDDALFGYDFSAGYTSLEQSGPKTSTKPVSGPLVRWWKRRRDEKEARRRELEAMEDGRVDEILAQVHATGLQSLSSDDRDLLNRVSARYRNRPR